MEEVWKDAVGYEDYFQVSSLGRVYSKRTNKILKLYRNGAGYLYLSTRFEGRNGKAKSFRVHRLIAEAFIDNPDNKPTVNHKNGNKQDNTVQNLEWSSYSENMRHAIDTNLLVVKRGIRNKNSKLTAADVEYIRLNPENKTVRELANILGVSHCTVVKCKNYLRY